MENPLCVLVDIRNHQKYPQVDKLLKEDKKEKQTEENIIFTRTRLVKFGGRIAGIDIGH